MLSIPSWSDLIRMGKAGREKTRQTFNPILVWFYQIEKSGKVEEVVDFQSHLGLILSSWRSGSVSRREELSIPSWSDFIKSLLFPGWGLISIFQSHLGLILSSLCDCWCWLWDAFNPILVWFYLYQRTVRAWHNRKSFNPILVWFYLHFFILRMFLITPTFNPILVWFYLDLVVGRETKTTFLSIPSWSDFISAGVPSSATFTWLSIPSWSDFIRLHNNSILPLSLVLSIPSWSDFIAVQIRPQREHKVLSIPSWSDFIYHGQ